MKDPVVKGTLCWLHRRSVPIMNITDGSAISFSSSDTHKGGGEIVPHTAVFPLVLERISEVASTAIGFSPLPVSVVLATFDIRREN